jgi:hypothetical protein
MYQISDWSRFAPDHHGYLRAPDPIIQMPHRANQNTGARARREDRCAAAPAIIFCLAAAGAGADCSDRCGRDNPTHARDRHQAFAIVVAVGNGLDLRRLEALAEPTVPPAPEEAALIRWSRWRQSSASDWMFWIMRGESFPVAARIRGNSPRKAPAPWRTAMPRSRGKARI